MLRLGATLPLTGDYASYGKLIRDGVELARKHLAAQGHTVEVRYEDVPTPGAAAVTAIRKLIHQDEIDGLVANFWNPAIPSMAPDLNRYKVPAFHTAAADDLILSAGDYVFSTNTKIKDEAKELAEYAYTTLGAKRASVLYIGTTFGDNYSSHFRKRFKALGGSVTYNETTLLGDNDLRAVLTKAKKSNPDVLFAAYFGTNLGIVLKQAKEMGITVPILSVYEAEDPSVITTAGTAANGIRFLISEPLDDIDKRQALRRAFEQEFGYQPRVLGRNAYDATMLLATRLEECKGDGVCAKDLLYKTKDYQGLSGDFSIDAEGAAKKSFALKTVETCSLCG